MPSPSSPCPPQSGPLLALDTAGAQCGVALAGGAHGEVERHAPAKRGHDQQLFALIREVCEQADTPLPRLAGIAAASGPGSFTGLRVGLAAAQGLTLALGVPGTGCDSLTLAAFAAAPKVRARGGGCVFVLLNAGRSEPFVQGFSLGADEALELRALAPPCAVPIAALRACIEAQVPAGETAFVVGDAHAALEALVADAGAHCLRVLPACGRGTASDLIRFVRARGFPQTPLRALGSPLYLRPPDTTPPKVSRAVAPHIGLSL